MDFSSILCAGSWGMHARQSHKVSANKGLAFALGLRRHGQGLEMVAVGDSVDGWSGLLVDVRYNARDVRCEHPPSTSPPPTSTYWKTGPEVPKRDRPR